MADAVDKDTVSIYFVGAAIARLPAAGRPRAVGLTLT